MFKNINMLTGALNASWKRNEVIANNIANANTPNFKRSRVEFEQHLSNSINRRGLQGTKTHNMHIRIGPMPINEIKPNVVRESNYSTRRDGNNVDIDVEMAELAKNQIWFNALLTRLNGGFSRLKSVINEGK